MRTPSMKVKLSLTNALVILLTIGFISVSANILINKQFERYITTQQKKKSQDTLTMVMQQHNSQTGRWDLESVHAIGMNALYEGYIIQVFDKDRQTIWNAETCNMSLCRSIMDDIIARMQARKPGSNGAFISKHYDLVREGQVIGYAHISYYGPYFLTENDFRFLDTLNVILGGISVFALLFSMVLGWMMARRITRPIQQTAQLAGQLAKGDYTATLPEHTDTKELNELIASVSHLAAALSQQENLRKQLTADVAHELRTPLTAVAAHIEAMIEGVWEPTQERLQSCYEEIARIGKLVQDLHWLSKVESQVLQLEKVPTALAGLCQKAIDALEPDIRGKDISITLEGHCAPVMADESRISQVLINLLTNAIHYVHGGGHIGLTLSETDQEVRLAVQDDGQGIPPASLPFLFERFYRVDSSRSRTTGGSGIGLAIVKSIVTAHGGTIQVESELGKGSIFRIALPKGNNPLSCAHPIL